MWEINDGAVPRAIVFSLSPCRAQLQLGRREQPTAGDLHQHQLLVAPLAEAVAQALAKDDLHQRAERLAAQRDAAVRELALADATVRELGARRLRLTLQAAPGLADELIGLDREARTVQGERDEAAGRVAILQAELDRLARELERRRLSAIRVACGKASEALAARRAALLAEVAARVGPLLEELLALELAVVELSRPDALAERVANLTPAPCPPTPPPDAQAQAHEHEDSPSPPAPQSPDPDPEPDPDPVRGRALVEMRRRGRKAQAQAAPVAAPVPE